MSMHVDIVIHGGGLAGNSLALTLAKTSLRIAVIEPFPPSDEQRHLLESRTIALSHGTRRIYEGMGIWPELAPFCTPIKHIHVSDKGRFGMTRIHAEDQSMPALGYVLQIAEVNRVITEKLKQYPDIYYFMPAKITEAQLINGKWQIEIESDNRPLSKLAAERQKRGASNITCDLLIAADGGQSPLRAMAGLNVEEKDYQQTAIVTSVQLTRAHDNIAYERFIDDGPIALLPVKEDVCAVVVTVKNHALATWQAMTDAEFLRTLQEKFGYRLGRFVAIGSRTSYPLKLIQAKQQISAQFVLVGNAAHILHPVAAQSFNLSLRDIAVLAELIVKSDRNKQSISDPALLDEYAKQRQADQHRTVKFTDELIELFANPVLALPRNIAMTGLDMAPPLKALLGKYGAGTLGKLSRLARGLGI